MLRSLTTLLAPRRCAWFRKLAPRLWITEANLARRAGCFTISAAQGALTIHIRRNELSCRSRTPPSIGRLRHGRALAQGGGLHGNRLHARRVRSLQQARTEGAQTGVRVFRESAFPPDPGAIWHVGVPGYKYPALIARGDSFRPCTAESATTTQSQ